jgi:hypothetical protein
VIWPPAGPPKIPYSLKRDDIVAGIVHEFCRHNILFDVFVLNFQSYGPRIIIDAGGVRHRNDAGRKVGTGRRNRLMEIMGKGCDAAQARKMIADECHSLDRVH